MMLGPLLAQTTGRLSSDLIVDTQKAVLPFLEAGAEYQPEQLVQANNLAKESGLAEPLVRENIQDTMRRVQSKKIEQNKMFAGWATQSKKNAALAMADIEAFNPMFENLEMLERLRADGFPLEDQSNQLVGAGKSAIKTAGRAPGVIAESTYQLIGLGVGWLENLNKLLGIVDDNETGVFGEARDWALNWGAEGVRKNYLESELLSLPEHLRGPLLDNLQNLINPEYLMFQTGEIINSMGAAYLLGGGMAKAVTVPTGLAMGVSNKTMATGALVEAGSLYEQEIKNGLSNEQALTVATAFGTVTGLLEKFGLDKILPEGPSKSGFVQRLWKMLVGGSAEAVTEYAENPAQGIIQGLVRGEAPQEILARAIEGLKEIDVIPGAFLAGGSIRGFREASEVIQNRRETKALAEVKNSLAEAVDSSKIKQMSPEMTEEILEQNGLYGPEYISGETALELMQSDPAYAEAFNLSPEQVMEKAAMGQDIEVPAARLMSRLTKEQYAKVAEVMKAKPDGLSLAEAQSEDRMTEDLERVVASIQEQEEFETAFSAERQRLQDEFVAAVDNVPGLKAQAESLAGGVNAYVEQALQPLESFARRMGAMGQDSIETLRRVTTKAFEKAPKVLAGIRTYDQTPGDGQRFPPPRFEGNDSIIDTIFSGSKTIKSFNQTALNADEALATDAVQWGLSIDKFLDKPNQKRRIVTMLNHAPLVLQMLGAKNQPVRTATDILHKVIIKKHHLPPELIKQIPAAMADPIMVFQSASQPGRLVMMLELQDERGATVVVPVSLEDSNNKGYTINFVPSIYTKLNEDTGIPQNQWFINQIKKGNLLYKHETKSRNWMISNGFQLPLKETSSTTTSNNIYTDANLVKLREANPGMYQDGKGNARGSVSVYPEGYLINLFKKADLSTLLHETGHVFLEEMERMVQSGAADEALINDYTKLKEWLARFEVEANLEEEYKYSVSKTANFKGRKFSDLNNEEKNTVRQIAEKEYFARGFEAYLMEGKAPSPELAGAFERFKHWLLTVYEKARRTLGVELTDDVRGVFDRLLATKAEIERTAIANELFSLTQKELDALGLKGAERNYQAALLEAAKRKSLEKLQQARDKERKIRIRDWTLEAREDILKDHLYQARAELYTKGNFLDGEAVIELYGEDVYRTLQKKLGALAIKPGGKGQDPELFAARHGFDDGAELMAALIKSRGLTEQIKEIVRTKEAAFDANIKAKTFLLETDEATRQIELVGQYLARNLGREAVQQEAFRKIAQEKLAAMTMRQARLDVQFTAAMRRALRKERVAIGKGDFEAALAANTQARLNMEFARQARVIAKLQTSIEREAKRFVAMSKADPAARFIVNDIAARFDLMPYDQRLIENKDINTIKNWLAAKEKDGFPLYAPEEIFYNPGRSWREITVPEFQNISEVIKQVITVERNNRQLLTAQDKADFQEAVGRAVETVCTHNKAKPIKVAEEESRPKIGLARIDASHTKIESLLLELDGDKPLGENWNLIYKPINDASDRRGLMFKDLSEKMNGPAVFGLYSQKELLAMARTKHKVKGHAESFTKMQAIMAGLNYGNEGNRQRLLDGYGWTEEQAQAILSLLDKRDAEFIQGVLELFESYKKEAFDLQESVTGQRPTAVEASPWSFRTADGEKIEMAGGYFPAKYNPKHAKVDLQDKLFTDSNPAFAMTRHGHLKEREGQGAGTPLNLDIGIVPSALMDVITDICYRKAVIDVGRVLRHQEYRRAIESTKGHEKYQAMVDWLKDAATESKPRSEGESIAQWARSSATFYNMGIKITTILNQPFGITQSIELLGYANTMKGLYMAYGKSVRATLETINWVKSVSPMMAQRIKNWDREVTDATNDFARKSLTPDSLIQDLMSKAGLGKFTKWLKDNAFMPMGVVQFGVDLPTWLGAYQKGIKDFMGNETKAREYADSIVRLSQGSGEMKDLARIQRGSQYVKLFTMFYSYFNTLYNLTRRRVRDVAMNRDAASVLRAANSFLLLYVIPSTLTEMVAGRGPDDDEDGWAWTAKQLMMYPLQTIVGLRTLAPAVEGQFSYKASSAEDAPATIYNFISTINKALTDEDYELDGKKFAKLSLRTVGYLAGLPLGQAEISAFNVWDYMDGTSSNFEFRDLLFRRQESRR